MKVSQTFGSIIMIAGIGMSGSSHANGEGVIVEEIGMPSVSGVMTAQSLESVSCLEYVLPEDMEYYRVEIDHVLEILPCALQQRVRRFEWLEDDMQSRAMANATTIYLSRDFYELAEWDAVLIHEVGHVVDLQYLSSRSFAEITAYRDGNLPVWADDPSVQYYALSWVTDMLRTKSSRLTDFASGYGQSNPFEDFAEAFVLYVDHGRAFRTYAAANSVMEMKYEFLRDIVFEGREYDTGSYGSADLRVYDVTLLGL